MLTKEDLQAISELIAAQEARLDAKLVMQEERLEAKLAAQEARIMHNTQILIENTVTPRFNLLDEKLDALQEKMVPVERLEKVERDVAVLKVAVQALASAKN